MYDQIPHDVTVVLSISRKVLEKLNALQTTHDKTDKTTKAMKGFLPTLVHIKKKGSGIATSLRFELNSFSLVTIHAFDVGQRPFLDFVANQTKLRLDGVATCLTGEMSSVLKLSFYHPLSGESLFIMEYMR